MNKIAILYGTTGGSVKYVADQIVKLFDGQVDLFDVSSVSVSEIEKYKYLLLGTSTTGIGDLQEDWEAFLDSFANIDFSGKKVAIFGLGDSSSYSTSFVGSMKHIYDAIEGKVEIVGAVPDEGYTYDESMSVQDGVWVGLPLDEENEYDLTEERLSNWVETLKQEFV